MDEDLRNFMSEDEQEQMAVLLLRALHRKERKKAAKESKRFQYFMCQFEGIAEMEKEDDVDGKEPWEEEYFEVEIERLLRGICGFCLKHGLCPCSYHNGKRKENEYADLPDEELPF